MLPTVDQTVEPAGITEGSDGNLWFTYSFRQDIWENHPGVNIHFGAANNLGNATPTATVVGISSS